MNLFLVRKENWELNYDGKDYLYFFDEDDKHNFLKKRDDYHCAAYLLNNHKDLYSILNEANELNVNNKSNFDKMQFINRYANTFVYYKDKSESRLQFAFIRNVLFKSMFDENASHSWEANIIEVANVNHGMQSFSIKEYTDTELHDFSTIEDDLSMFKKRKTKNNIINEKTDMIYFISNSDAIKIGVSNNVKNRMIQLQTSYPYKLTLIKTIQGSYDKEKELHDRFSKYRLSGEWFVTNKELIEDIENLA